jgi:methylmalonyl-CoA/ethylmalonyl-CoA epimerase
MIERFDHVGVIVDDLDEAARLLTALGLVHDRSVERDDLRLAFFRAGEVSVEIIEPLDPELRRTRLGEGTRARIEHIAFDVADLQQTLDALDALDVRPNAPPANSMFWTEPETSDGIMFQFVQRA